VAISRFQRQQAQERNVVPDRRHTIVLFSIGIAGVAMICGLIVLAFVLPPLLKQSVENQLSEYFASDVQMQEIEVSVFPRISLVASGVLLRQKGRTDVPPLIQISKLTLATNIGGILLKPRRISVVHLDGLQIHVPTRPHVREEKKPPIERKKPSSVVIGKVTLADATIEMAPNKPGRLPLTLQIHSLVMHSFSFEVPAPFEAVLTNPKPFGEIATDGQFGPWEADDPAETPVSGAFHFSHADMATIRGLSGFLDSNGKYAGVLREISVEGDTNIPDFALISSRKPVHLTTHYLALVDGTNGDTELKSVHAHFLNSSVDANGLIAGAVGMKGRRVTLDARINDARVEDMIYLVANMDKPSMTGPITMQSKIDIPPGDSTVLDRLMVDGQFGVQGAHFTDSGTQGKIDALSRGGQGQLKNENIENVLSNLRGHLVIKDGRATFSKLTFKVIGASVELSGSYDLKGQQLDFHGNLLLDGKLSQMTSGAKSFFLKLADPFFKKSGGGTSLPIKITGTGLHPSFALDLHQKSDDP
jgi:hypothetical protein